MAPSAPRHLVSTRRAPPSSPPRLVRVRNPQRLLPRTDVGPAARRRPAPAAEPPGCVGGVRRWRPRFLLTGSGCKFLYTSKETKRKTGPQPSPPGPIFACASSPDDNSSTSGVTSPFDSVLNFASSGGSGCSTATMRPGSSDRGRPADVNPPEADLVGVEAVEPQVAEDEGLDRTRPHALLTLPWESPPDSPIPRPISYGGYRSKYGSDSMPKGPTPYRLTST